MILPNWPSPILTRRAHPLECCISTKNGNSLRLREDCWRSVLCSVVPRSLAVLRCGEDFDPSQNRAAGMFAKSNQIEMGVDHMLAWRSGACIWSLSSPLTCSFSSKDICQLYGSISHPLYSLYLFARA